MTLLKALVPSLLDAVVGPVAVLLIAVLLVTGYNALYRLWRSVFLGRYPRTHPMSPSHGDLPELVRRCSPRNLPFAAAREQARQDAQRSHTFTLRQTDRKEKHGSKECHGGGMLSSSCPKGGSPVKENLSQGRARKLDYDHLQMGFGQHMWFCCFVILPWGFGALRGFVIYKIREILARRGWIKIRPYDPASLVARMALGTSMAIFYTKRLDENRNIALFHIDEVPVMRQSDWGFIMTKDFHFAIDLVKQRLVHARLNGNVLTASQCLTVLTFAAVTLVHISIHASGNWAVNLQEDRRCWLHPELYLASLMTVGSNSVPRTVESSPLITLIYPKAINVGYSMNQHFDQYIVEHGSVVELSKHSEFVRFVVGLRKNFFAAFAKHKDCCFAGISGEALFAGTVLHSMDHWRFETNVEDPLWFDVDCPQFGNMARVIGATRAAFTQDLPLTFSLKMRHARHPFFRAVYAHAAKIDQEWADHLDTCICK